jgi:TonB family protein
MTAKNKIRRWAVKNMNLKVFSFLLLILGAGSVFSQNPAPVLKDGTLGAPDETYKVDDVRGNIKRRAIYLPKPPYPREALEAGADGAVKVEVVLDREGKVVSAKAISGHPLLQTAAEETARKTMFRRSEAADPNAAETGVIVYNFAIEKMSWLKIGYDLAVIQKIPTLRPLLVPRIAKAFQPDWTGELEMLGKLAEMRRAEVEAENGSVTDDKPVLIQKPVQTTNSTTQISRKTELRVQIPIPNPPTPERIALAQNLTASLASRLGGDEANLWRFNTGVNLARALGVFRIPNEGRNAAQILRQALETAPGGISVETLTALKNLVEIFEGERRTVETPNEIGRNMGVLFGTK